MYRGLTTPPVFWPLLLYVRAGALAASGRPAAGVPLIEEAIEIAGRGPGLTLAPEFDVLKGNLLLALGEENEAAAEGCFLGGSTLRGDSTRGCRSCERPLAFVACGSGEVMRNRRACS